jgi:DNA anti-recombination protein RmuC
MKSALDRTESFYGRLSDTQKQTLRAQLDASAFDAATQYKETMRRQKDILQTLRALKAAPSTELQQQAEVRALLLRSTQSPDSSFQQYTERIRSNFCESAAELHNGTSPAQRQKLQQTLQAYEADVRVLMQR